MNEARPDPDRLLAAVTAEEACIKRGKLRIFFGASAGVGKTYSMLEAARNARAAGTDIVVGYVEPHGRVETERLLEGLEQLPFLNVSYRGIVRRELDLDAVLERRPAIVLVDELAHSNLVEADPPPRHAKRWQDIEELRDAGIDVWTTVNVQHLESLNDVVAQITGIRQRETVPDRIFDEASDIELIDLPPDDLLARLQAGKIYLPDEARTAASRFFRVSNLIALRELALRRMLDRVDASAIASASLDRSSRSWLARDRILVAVGPDHQAEQLVRAGKRIADALEARWSVVYVETPALLRLATEHRNRRIDVLRLAESLGAETVTLDGPSAGAALIEYAQTRNATRVIVGSPKRSGWRAWLKPSTTAVLTSAPRSFDIITIADSGAAPPRSAAATNIEQPVQWHRYGWAIGVTLLCTAVAALMYSSFELTNLVMVYVLGATIAGLRLGRGPGILAAIANVALFDFCFVPPRFTFNVSDVEYVVTFAVMLVVTLTIANLMASVRQQTRVAGARERRTAALYAMSRELAAARDVPAMARLAVRHVAEVFDCQAVVLLPDADGKLAYPRETPIEGSLRGAELSIAQWVADHGRRAGLGSDTLPAAAALYLPLTDAPKKLGVLAVLPTNRRRVLLPEQRNLLQTFASQIGLALERAQLAETAETARVSAETEALRNTLLASISHDLRTPLAVIAGASSVLARQGDALDLPARHALATSIESKAREMSDLVSNVLDLMRFESGQIALRADWETVDDLVGTALKRMSERLSSRTVALDLPADLPAVRVDAALIVQALSNLLDNACKYTPAGSTIRVSAWPAGEFVHLAIEDNGPGLPAGDLARLFDKFQRGSEEGAVVGVGLGLAICRSILRAHGGEITASRAAGGGARFELTLPTGEAVA